MSKWTYEYAPDIADADKDVLEEKRDAILGALMYVPIYWEPVKDSKGRFHYRALSYSDRSACLLQITVPDIRGCDAEELKGRIIAGDFKEREVEKDS